MLKLPKLGVFNGLGALKNSYIKAFVLKLQRFYFRQISHEREIIFLFCKRIN